MVVYTYVRTCLFTYLLTYLHTYLLIYLPTYLLIYLLTYLLHGSESFLKTNRFSASQEIPHNFWNLKVHYRIHKCPPPVLILSQLDPVHTPTSNFLKIHLNTLPSTPGCPKLSLSLRFPHQNPVYASPLPRTCYSSRSYHYSRFNHPNSIW